MNWNIEYFNSDIEDKILSLPDGLQARYFKLTEMMVIHGSNLGLPHTKSLSDGLF